LSAPLKVTAAGKAPKLAAKAAPTSLTASWNDVGASGYRAYLQDSEGNTVASSGIIPAGAKGVPVSHVFEGLDPNMSYRLAAAGVWNGVEGISAAVQAKTSGPAPKMRKAANISEISATISWEPVAGASGYVVTKDGVALPLVTYASYTDPNLYPGTAVAYKVQAVWPGSPVPGTAATQKVTPLGGAPGSLRAVMGLTEAKLSWKAVKGVSAYEVSAKDPDGNVVKKLAPVQGLAAELDGLSPYTQYKIEVSGIWHYGSRNERRGKPALATARTLGPATKVTAVKDSLTETSVTLAWKAVDGAAAYYIERNGELLEGYVPANNLGGLVYEDSDLMPGVTAKYAVYAAWELGENKQLKRGGPSNVLSVKPKGGGVPTGLSASASPMALTVSWKSVPNASLYRVYLYKNAKPEPGEEPSAVSAFSAADPDIPAAEGFATLSYRFEGLLPNTAYYARVVGVWQFADGSRREGAASATLKATTAGPAPNMLAANDIEPAATPGSYKLRLTWNAVNDRNVTGYLVTKTVGAKAEEPRYVSARDYYLANGFMDTANAGEKLSYAVQACWGETQTDCKPGKASSALKLAAPI
jgi:hypothetical protein